MISQQAYLSRNNVLGGVDLMSLPIVTVNKMVEKLNARLRDEYLKSLKSK